MAYKMQIKPDQLTDAQRAALQAFWNASQGEDTRGKTVCHFCGGGNRCRCGQCPEFEWHTQTCMALLVYQVLDFDDLTLLLSWNWQNDDEAAKARVPDKQAMHDDTPPPCPDTDEAYKRMERQDAHQIVRILYYACVNDGPCGYTTGTAEADCPLCGAAVEAVREGE